MRSFGRVFVARLFPSEWIRRVIVIGLVYWRFYRFCLLLFIIGFPGELSSARVFSMYVSIGGACVFECVYLYVFVLYLFVSVMKDLSVYFRVFFYCF